MIALESTPFEGMYAAPLWQPVNNVNPAPWLIEQVKITHCDVPGQPTYKVWIRGQGSEWYRADQCEVGAKERVEHFMAQDVEE